MNFSKTELKNFLINKSLLNEKEKSIKDVLIKLSCIQVDPVKVVAPSHEIALWNRVENYTPDKLENMLYKNKELFEYWLQLYSIIPVEYYAYLNSIRNSQDDWHKKYLKDHKAEITEILEFAAENNTVSVKDISHLKPGKSVLSWKGTSSNKALLEFLWETGKLEIVGKLNNNKVYAIPEKIIPNSFLNQSLSESESKEFIIKSYFKYLGIIRTNFFSKMYYSYRLNLKETFKNLIDRGEIVNIQIEDTKSNYYILKEDIDNFKNFKKQHSNLNILSPLDPLIIDRQLIKDIFDFDYKWEIYIPESKRKFGSYGMPILFNGDFVGQIQLNKDRNKLKISKSELNKKTDKNLLKKTIHELEKII